VLGFGIISFGWQEAWWAFLKPFLAFYLNVLQGSNVCCVCSTAKRDVCVLNHKAPSFPKSLLSCLQHLRPTFLKKLVWCWMPITVGFGVLPESAFAQPHCWSTLPVHFFTFCSTDDITLTEQP